MPRFFEFEADFINSLRCIPLCVRMNLDTCGVKLKLSHWHQLTQQERQLLVSLPCTTPEEIKIYRDFLQDLVTKKTGTPAGELPIDPDPPWLNSNSLPKQVEDKAAEFKIKISLEDWANLTSLERFALIKLSRPSHENVNFYPALEEFKLV